MGGHHTVGGSVSQPMVSKNIVVSISLGLCLSLTLAIVTVGESQALGEGVQPGAGAEGDGSLVASVEVGGGCLGLPLALVIPGTRHRHVGGVDTRGGLEPKHVVRLEILARHRGHHSRIPKISLLCSD